MFVSLDRQIRDRGILIVSDAAAKGYQGTREVGVRSYSEFSARVDVEPDLGGNARYCQQYPWRAVAHPDERCEGLLGVCLGNDLSIRRAAAAERRWANDCASLCHRHQQNAGQQAQGTASQFLCVAHDSSPSDVDCTMHIVLLGYWPRCARARRNGALEI